jgi:acyl carrier protein
MNADDEVLMEVLAQVREMTQCDPLSLRAESRFFAELGLSSIDAIVLSERLEQRFGRPLQFADALAELARAGRDDVTLGEVAAFVRLQLHQPRPRE